MKNMLKTLGIAILGGATVLGIQQLTFDEENFLLPQEQKQIATQQAPIIQTGYSGSPVIKDAIDFTDAAEATVNAVVHVKNTTIARGPVTMRDYFMGRSGAREMIGTGSGVIITPDGYIVTNNHVIENSTDLEVTLNDNRIYKAELVGTDKKSDIALIKIDPDEDLPYIAFGDSNALEVGEWVLAVGNPFNLTSTVTAGIVSAKARDLNERDATAQSFIQTDAAVNRGNSGGALVNARGELVGINTAITSETGSYVGYAFAVPSNNARKIIEDIMEYGSVQKGVLGISGFDLNSRTAEQLGVKTTQGIVVSQILPDSGAEKSKLEEGDVITHIDGVKITKFADLTGYVGSRNPGDKVHLSVLRDEDQIKIPLTLSKRNYAVLPDLEMEVRNINKKEKRQYGVDSGVRITGLSGETKLKNEQYGYSLTDYVITKVNNTSIKNVEDVQAVLSEIRKGEILLVEMVNSEGVVERYRMRK